MVSHPRVDAGRGSIVFGDRRRRSTWASARWLIAAWFILSVAWSTAVLADLYHRAREEAKLANDVERELDMSACAGADCESAASDWREGWRDVARTYLQFGYVDILIWAIVPPIGILIAGSGTILLIRRRQREAEKRAAS